MRIIRCLFAGIIGVVMVDAAFSHGGAGNNKTYEADDEPKLDFRKHAPSFSLPADNATPVMSMSVAGRTLRVTFKNTYGEPVNVDGVEAKAFVSAGGKTTIVPLMPTMGNALSGAGDFVPEPDMRVDVTLRLVGQRPINQTFYPMR